MVLWLNDSWYSKKKGQDKIPKSFKKLDFSTNSIWSRSRLFVSYYALTQCTVCNVTLFWHHLDILLSSSAHQIRHIYLVKCLIMFLLPKSIYYLVAPRLWSLMLFKKNGTPITLKDSIVVSKGQLISKCLFGVFNFLQKTNENKSIWGFIVVK